MVPGGGGGVGGGVWGSCWGTGRGFVSAPSWGTAVFMQPVAGPMTELGQQGVRPGGPGPGCLWVEATGKFGDPPSSLVQCPQGSGLALFSAPGVSLLWPLLLLQPSEASELRPEYN